MTDQVEILDGLIYRVQERELRGGVVEKRYYDSSNKLVDVRRVQPVTTLRVSRNIPRWSGTGTAEIEK